MVTVGLTLNLWDRDESFGTNIKIVGLTLGQTLEPWD